MALTDVIVGFVIFVGATVASIFGIANAYGDQLCLPRRAQPRLTTDCEPLIVQRAV